MGAIAAPGLVARGDDPDAPSLGVEVGGGGAEGAFAAGVVQEAAVFVKLFRVDGDALGAAVSWDGHTQSLCISLDPIRQPHKLVLAVFVGFGGVFGLLGADDEGHGVLPLTPPVGEAPLVDVAADGADVLVERADLICVQLGKLVPVRDPLVISRQLGGRACSDVYTEFNQLTYCRCRPAGDIAGLQLWGVFICPGRILKAAVDDRVVGRVGVAVGSSFRQG